MKTLHLSNRDMADATATLRRLSDIHPGMFGHASVSPSRSVTTSLIGVEGSASHLIEWELFLLVLAMLSEESAEEMLKEIIPEQTREMHRAARRAVTPERADEYGALRELWIKLYTCSQPHDFDALTIDERSRGYRHPPTGHLLRPWIYTREEICAHDCAV